MNRTTRELVFAVLIAAALVASPVYAPAEELAGAPTVSADEAPEQQGGAQGDTGDQDQKRDKDKPTGRTRYAEKSVKMYKARKTSSKSLKTIPAGAEVYEVSTRGKWSKVQYGGKTGYVKTSRLTDTAPAETTGSIDVNSMTEADGPSASAGDGTGMRDLDAKKDKAYNWSGQIVLGIGGMPIPLLFQYDYDEPVCVFGGMTRSVHTSGCGVTSLSMIIAYLTGNTEQSPYTLFREACQDDMYHGAGLSHEAIQTLGERYGVSGVWKKLKSEELIETLRAGTPVIAHMGEGLFTEGGHYIVLRGVTEDGKILINDPGSAERSKMAYPVSIIEKQSKSSAPFMVCSLKSGVQKKSANVKTSVRVKAKARASAASGGGPSAQNA